MTATVSKIRELALEFRDPGFSSALVQTNRIKSKSLPCQPALPLNACFTKSSNIHFREKCYIPSFHTSVPDTIAEGQVQRIVLVGVLIFPPFPYQSVVCGHSTHAT